jgi:hypothetical protein
LVRVGVRYAPTHEHPPTKDQITAALDRAVIAVRDHTRYPSRVRRCPLPKQNSEPRGERWWLIGHIRILAATDEWGVLYAPVTDEGRLRAKR